MQRRTFLGLSALLGIGATAGAFGGWTLFGPGGQPLLLSARDGGDGRHYAVGYRLDGERAFVGGINIVDDFDAGLLSHPRYDYAVQVEGPLLEPIVASAQRLWRLVAWADGTQWKRASPGTRGPWPSGCGQ